MSSNSSQAEARTQSSQEATSNESTTFRKNLSRRVPNDPDQVPESENVDMDSVEAVEKAAQKPNAIESNDFVDGGSTVVSNSVAGSRVRFRVEPTTLYSTVPSSAIDHLPTFGTRSALRNSRGDWRVGEESGLDSTDSLSGTATGDSNESLYNLPHIVPPLGAVNDRTLGAASFIDSIPPYVTVRLPADVPSPALPLSWICNSEKSKYAVFPAGVQSTSSSTSNWRNLNKSASYTAANTPVLAPAAIVSQAYRNYFMPSSTGGGRGRKYSAGRIGRQQSAQRLSSLGPTSSASTSGQAIPTTTAFGSADDVDYVESQLPSTPIFPSLKHVQTEYVMSKHALKAKLNKYQSMLDSAFAAVTSANEAHRAGSCDGVLHHKTSLIEDALAVVAKIFRDAWAVPSLGLDLAYGLCNYVREMAYLDIIVDLYLHDEVVRKAAGLALEGCFSCPNRDYLVSHRGLLEPLALTAKSETSPTTTRVSLRIFEGLFRQDPQTSARLISMSALDYVLNACKASTDPSTFRHAAFALANLAIYSDHDCQQKMLEKNVPDWLFLLASSQDDVTRYYACLAICALVSNKEIETAVTKSGTLSLVEPFLSSLKPADFSMKDARHRQGRRREWLEKLVPMLSAKRREPRAMAAFHFAVEATIKKKQEQLHTLREIGAIDALKQAAALPDELASKFASVALGIIGEQCPPKLSPQVPLWTVEDVQYWATQIGFEDYAPAFREQKVDGDLLLLLTNEDLCNDVGMVSALYRKRFMRELDSLKMAADYGCIDETRLDRFLASVDPHFSVYTYRLLEMGVDFTVLPSLSDSVLKDDCGILNPVHRLKLLASLEEFKHVDDVEVALLRKRIDIFVSYRRSTGNQLASLLKVLLQLRSHKVFIDVDRLYAGQFDASLLKNIQAAKHFILVLTPHALDRCIGDDACNDWVHKEVRCALEHNLNVIPVLDPRFEWPDDSQLPADMKAVTRFNAVRWVHEYQEACVIKIEKFIKGETNVNRGFYPSLPQRNKFLPAYNRSTSKPNNGTASGSSTDLVLDALSTSGPRVQLMDDSSSGRRSSHELLALQPQDVVWDYN